MTVGEANELNKQNILLSLKDIHKSFAFGEQTLEVLHGISLDVAAGDMVAIIGQSGSGKSTLMNIMACLDTPTSGEYLISGCPVHEMDSDMLAGLRRDKFGFIFQRYQLLSSLNAAENVAVPAVYAGVSPHQRLARANELLAKLGLQERTGHYPNQLSGGQQQRVSIARALMNGGQIIFADEPTGALDSHSSRDVMEILLQLNHEGHTVILVTHDPKIAALAKRVIEISDGVIVRDERNAPLTEENTIMPSESTLPRQTKRFMPFLGSLKEAFGMALLTMFANKMRTLLTMLGIIIGIASVVLIVALGNGSKQKVLNEINSVGSATLIVSAGREGDKRTEQVESLTLDDMHILAKLPFVDSVSPNLSSTMTAQVGNKERQVQVDGVNTSHHRLQNVRFLEGSMFRQPEMDSMAQHIIISDKTKQAFFPNQSAVGEIIMLNGAPNRVIGVFQYKGIEGNYDRSLKIWMPYRTLQARFIGDSSHLDSMTLLLQKGYSSTLASQGVKQTLINRHGKEDFTIFNSDSLSKTIEKTAQSLTLLVGAIAVISLLVGGIGVMNIMLVSVTERTGEIGVRMAVGARYINIVQQFLIEAMVVCAIGGMIGVLLAFGFGALLQTFNVPIAFSASSIGLAVLCASLIGLVFGFMPAHKAAKMNPIDALNHI
ncbi:MacB family efflux pump subunit [Wielerella bovis]|uniref:MacB family efflux pump subunit n=1 Tax=Wielerella bovis TaxID=2917790 RepID=UPI002019D03A|nr:MacB family efflux pump subunit [Wielerella bovis]MCG7657343.1 MacB family efflux pump subunit [Wielerella bovis]MCG7659564.1 MacB family efflux pump subunit [Wielerella bovis]